MYLILDIYIHSHTYTFMPNNTFAVYLILWYVFFCVLCIVCDVLLVSRLTFQFDKLCASACFFTNINNLSRIHRSSTAIVRTLPDCKFDVARSYWPTHRGCSGIAVVGLQAGALYVGCWYAFRQVVGTRMKWFGTVANVLGKVLSRQLKIWHWTKPSGKLLVVVCH